MKLNRIDGNGSDVQFTEEDRKRLKKLAKQWL